MSELTVSDRVRLDQLEQIVDAGLHTFVDVALALLEIHDSRLYRDTHPTFEAYCDDRWAMTARHARRLMQAAHVIELTGPTGPTSERQARELVPLLDQPEDLNEAWEEAMQVSAGKPTAAVVATAAKKRVLTDDERARILALHANGKNQRQIAETVGCSQGGVSKVIRAAADDRDRLPKRRQPATAQTLAISKLHRVCRDWDKLGDEDYIPAPEIARRLRVLEQALTFIGRKRNHYYALTGKAD